MRAPTLRRLIVFGVCAVGVSCLYLLPGVSRAPQPAPNPRTLDEPTAGRPGGTTRDASRPVAAPGEAFPSRTVSDPTTGPVTEADQPGYPEPTPTHPSTSDALASEPVRWTDDESPAAVADVTSAAVTPSRLSLRWPAASDNVGVVGYSVVLDGFEVATTAETSTTIRWFNDDAREHLVQVRAIDAAGNLSTRSANLLVTRPTPAPTPTPEPVAPTPEPTSTPTPDPAPTASPSAPAPSGRAEEAGRESAPPEPAERVGPAGPAEAQAPAPAGVR